MPKISIIVPVYNGEEYIKDTIDSVRSQTEKDWELLLVDDCSGDKSRDIIEELGKEDKRIVLIPQPQNAGAAAARNRGLSEAKGRYIAFLDADDIWKDTRLEDGLAYMEQLKKEGKEAGFIFSGYEFADENAKGLGIIVRVPRELCYRQALGNTTIFTSTVLFDTQVIPPSLIKMPLVKSEDTATWWQILRNGYRAYGLDKNLVLYRRGKNTLSSDKIQAIKRIWYLYRKVEKLSVPESAYHFMCYAVRAVIRRV